MLTKGGDLIAEVKYKKLDQGDLIAIPTEPEPAPIPPPDKKPIEVVIPNQIENEYRLSWPTAPIKMAARKPGTVIIRGTNNRDKTQQFNEIRMTFDAKQAPRLLFFENDFKTEEEAAEAAAAAVAEAAKPKPVKDTPMKGTPTKDTPTKDTPVKDAAASGDSSNSHQPHLSLPPTPTPTPTHPATQPQLPPSFPPHQHTTPTNSSNPPRHSQPTPPRDRTTPATPRRRPPETTRTRTWTTGSSRSCLSPADPSACRSSPGRTSRSQIHGRLASAGGDFKIGVDEDWYKMDTHWVDKVTVALQQMNGWGRKERKRLLTLYRYIYIYCEILWSCVHE